MDAEMKPENFSWVVEGLLAGSSFPSQPRHFDFFKTQGIKHVVTLTEWRIPPAIVPPGVSVKFLPVVEFAPPSLRQVVNFVELVDRAKANQQAVVCHCHWGRGRTGTMLAAYLVAHSNLPAREAIDKVRRMRPYSVETGRQERVVHSFAEYARRRRAGADSHSLEQFMSSEDAQNGVNGKNYVLDDNNFIFY